MSKPVPTKKKADTKKSKRWLRVQLSREELLSAGKEQADKLTERSRLDEDLKRIKDDFKAKISALDARINTLTSVVSTGYEYRNVTCTEHLGEPAADKKRVVRDDTGEQIGIEEMTQAEMQRELLEQQEANPNE
jgi:hypothetical protein